MTKIERLRALSARLENEHPAAATALDELAELQEAAIRQGQKQAALAALEAFEEGQELDPRAHARLLALKQGLEGEVRALIKQLDRVQVIERALIAHSTSAAIRAALTAAGARHHVDLLAQLIQQEHGIEGRLGDQGGLELDQSSLDLHVQVLKGDPDYERFFSDQTAQADQGDQSSNPWLPASWNLTRQCTIWRSNPGQARKLQAAAEQQQRQAQPPTLTELARLYKRDPIAARNLARQHGIESWLPAESA